MAISRRLSYTADMRRGPLAKLAVTAAYLLSSGWSAVCAMTLPAARASAIGSAADHACCARASRPARSRPGSPAPCCAAREETPALLPAAAIVRAAPALVFPAPAAEPLVAPVPAAVRRVVDRAPPGAQVLAPSSPGPRAPPSPAAVL